jgi:hypothetical protein
MVKRRRSRSFRVKIVPVIVCRQQPIGRCNLVEHKEPAKYRELNLAKVAVAGLKH